MRQEVRDRERHACSQRQCATHLVEYRPKLRYDVDEQYDDRKPRDSRQYGRVDQSRENLVLQCLGTFEIRCQLLEAIAQGATGFGSANHADMKRRKSGSLRLERT